MEGPPGLKQVMNIDNERKLCARATALGESADPSVFDELVQLTRSESRRVRRLSASALGKLAGIVSNKDAVNVLTPLLQDTHPQVRQYSAKALGAYGTHAQAVLPDLRDLYKNPNEKDYVKRSVVRAGKAIRESMRIRDAESVHRCRRCGKQVDADEYARSQRAFQRCFCDPCFDEVYLDRRNFETKVELQKTICAGASVIDENHLPLSALQHMVP